MQAAIDRVMHTYGMIVNLTLDEEQAARDRLTAFLAQAQTQDENQLAGEGKNFFDRDALGYQHVVDYSEHHHHIEGAVRTFEKRRALAVTPAESGGRAAQVDYEWQDIELLFRGSLPDASGRG